MGRTSTSSTTFMYAKVETKTTMTDRHARARTMSERDEAIKEIKAAMKKKRDADRRHQEILEQEEADMVEEERRFAIRIASKKEQLASEREALSRQVDELEISECQDTIYEETGELTDDNVNDKDSDNEDDLDESELPVEVDNSPPVKQPKTKPCPNALSNNEQAVRNREMAFMHREKWLEKREREQSDRETATQKRGAELKIGERVADDGEDALRKRMTALEIGNKAAADGEDALRKRLAALEAGNKAADEEQAVQERAIAKKAVELQERNLKLVVEEKAIDDASKALQEKRKQIADDAVRTEPVRKPADAEHRDTHEKKEHATHAPSPPSDNKPSSTGDAPLRFSVSRESYNTFGVLMGSCQGCSSSPMSAIYPFPLDLKLYLACKDLGVDWYLTSKTFDSRLKPDAKMAEATSWKDIDITFNVWRDTD